MITYSKKAVLALSLLLTLIAGSTAKADPTTAPVSDEIKTNLATYRTKMSDAATKMDIPALVDLMYPKIIEKAGGKEKLLSGVEASKKQMADNGVAFKSVALDEPDQVIKSGDNYYAVMSEKVVMTVPNGTITTDSALVAISTDGGKTWSFVDGSAGGVAIRMMLPEVPRELNLPDKAKTIFTPDPKK